MVFDFVPLHSVNLSLHAPSPHQQIGYRQACASPYSTFLWCTERVSICLVRHFARNRRSSIFLLHPLTIKRSFLGIVRVITYFHELALYSFQFRLLARYSRTLPARSPLQALFSLPLLPQSSLYIYH